MNIDENLDPSRRRFLLGALVSGACYGAGLFPGVAKSAPSSAFPVLRGRVLVNLTLAGGPDFRHLMPPAFDRTRGSYGRTFWEHRARALGSGSSLGEMQNHWQTRYFPARHGSTEFGILRSCGWLRKQWEAGHVSVVANVFGSKSRDHDYAMRVMNLGDTNAGKFDEGSGWGGRLAHVAGDNVVALTSTPQAFALSPDPKAPNNLRKSSQARLLLAGDTRNISLYSANARASWLSSSQQTTIALQHYYASKRPTIEENSPYHRFLEHERKLREFGDAVDSRLAGNPLPKALKQLTNENSPVRQDLGLQTRNLYDALLCADILDMRVASMSFDGWDSHDDQAAGINPMLKDLFGNDGALARLHQLLPSPVRNRLVFVISGEFGRQLADNGGNGTDHGVGNSVLLIGHGVRGGLHGDLFPASEIKRYRKVSSDIRGLTAIDHVFGAACEWTEAGSQNHVFPKRERKPLESGVDPKRFFI